MANQIDLRPKVLDLILYAGDGMSLRLLFKDTTGAPIDVNGAVEAQVRVNRLDADPPVAQFTVGLVDAYLGIVVVSLTGDQTQDMIDNPVGGDGTFNGVWDLEWTPAGSQPRTMIQGNVECVADVTR